MSANGYLLPSELEQVQAPGEYLAHSAAHAYRWLQHAFQAQNVALTISAPAGTYRSFFVQGDMHVHPAKYDLNPDSSITLAAAGHSSHGFGTRADMLFDGSSWPDQHHLDTCAKYGWTREFGADDPNHFMHDGKTAIPPFTTVTTPSEESIAQALELMEDSMLLFKGKDKPNVYQLVGGHKRGIGPKETALLQALGQWHVQVVDQATADGIAPL